MERLTYWCDDGMGGGEYRVNENGTEYSGHFIDRLAAYEDTGLEPEEIKNLKNGIIPDHWAELFKAECEGRLIVLPCKVGDTVYWIKGKAILEVYIQWFETNAYGWCACGTYPPMATPTFRFADFGKTVFLTRAAAEAALEKEETSDG